MEYKVKVLRPYRGLHEGDILVFNSKTKMFELREVDEVVGDNYHSKNTRMISFSPEFIERFLDQVFEDLDGIWPKEQEKEPEKVDETEKDVDELESLKDMVSILAKEIEELRPKVLKAKTKKKK